MQGLQYQRNKLEQLDLLFSDLSNVELITARDFKEKGRIEIEHICF